MNEQEGFSANSKEDRGQKVKDRFLSKRKNEYDIVVGFSPRLPDQDLQRDGYQISSIQGQEGRSQSQQDQHAENEHLQINGVRSVEESPTSSKTSKAIK